MKKNPIISRLMRKEKMDRSEQSLITKMEQYKNRLTNAKHVITNNTFSRTNSVMKKSTAELAIAIGDATLYSVRFFRKLYYLNYFQMNLLSYGISTDELFLPSIDSDNAPVSVLEKYFVSRMNRLIQGMR